MLAHTRRSRILNEVTNPWLHVMASLGDWSSMSDLMLCCVGDWHGLCNSWVDTGVGSCMCVHLGVVLVIYR